MLRGLLKDLLLEPILLAGGLYRYIFSLSRDADRRKLECWLDEAEAFGCFFLKEEAVSLRNLVPTYGNGIFLFFPTDFFGLSFVFE